MSSKFFKPALFILILVFLKTNSFSQFQGYDVHINYFWDFYSNNRLSTVNAGKGYTGIASNNDIGGSIINPASLDLKSKFEVHGEYVIKNNVPWLTALIPSQMYLKELHPGGLISAGYKINESFQTGLIFYYANSHTLDLGTIIMTDEFGNQLGTYTASYNTSKSSLSAPLVFNYKNKFKAGINLIFSMFNASAKYSDLTGIAANNSILDGKSNFNLFTGQIGFIYSPVSSLSLGLTISIPAEHTIVWQYGTLPQETFPQLYTEPMKIGVGAEYRFKNTPLKLAFEYNYVNSSQMSWLRDRHDVNFGAEYELNRKITIRGGFFTVRDFRFGEYIDPYGEYNEYFLTAGGSFKLGIITASVSLMDSHISTGLIKQTLLNGGITMDF